MDKLNHTIAMEMFLQWHGIERMNKIKVTKG